MTTLILGSSGQLATHLRELLPTALAWGRPSKQLWDPSDLTRAIEELFPSAIVNAAAYTAVDAAESECDLAWQVNAEIPAAAARAAARLDVPLLHISTDYVFDGSKAGAYRDSDAVNPINVYGRTKLGGELAVSTLCSKYWILRSSWIFSEHGKNFVKTILHLARTRDCVSVVADQFGRPTYAGDLARLIIEILPKEGCGPAIPYGTYHAVGGQVVSWYEFSKIIFERANNLKLIDRSPQVDPIGTDQFPTAAVRPLNSVLQPSREIECGLNVSFDWRAGLDLVLQRLNWD